MAVALVVARFALDLLGFGLAGLALVANSEAGDILMSAENKANIRSKLRSNILSSKKFRSEVVDIPVENGEEPLQVELRQPTIGERFDLLKRYSAETGNVSMEILVQLVIDMSYVPGTKERVFEQADYEAILNQPAGGLIDTLGNKALALLNVDEQKDEEAKNSEAAADSD